MSNEQPPPSTHDDEADAKAEQRSRRSAQGAASELARMGIDPRSLGLDESTSRPTPAARAAGPDRGRSAGDPGARIVPLRPEFAEQEPSASAGSARTDRVASRSVAPVGPDTVRPVNFRGPVEDLIARTAVGKRAPKAPSRLVRAVTLGLITPDAAQAVGTERELVAGARHRQTERRVVAFTAGKGGVGTTTVASGVGAVFAALREDRTVLVDVQAGTHPLSVLHGVEGGVGARTLLQQGRSPGTGTGAGLDVVDGVGWDQPLQRREVVALLDRLGTDHVFHLLDAGNDTGDASHVALARSDQAVVVTGVGELGLRALEVATTRLRQVNPGAAERAVYVVVCTHDKSHRVAHREVTERLSVTPARIVVMPPDPVLASGAAFDSAAVAPATRAAMLEVAAALALSGGGR